MTETEVQWRVTWFGLVSHKHRTGTEAWVREYAEAYPEDSPIIERRTVTTTPWEIVQNQPQP